MTVLEMTNTHAIVTKDYPENPHGGIMICGINFGLSQNDEDAELSDKYDSIEPKSFFSDRAVCNYYFRNRILKWLKDWGVLLETQTGKEGQLERSFFRANWIDSQSKNINSDGKIDIKFMVQKENCNGILKLLEDRKPS